MRVPSGRGNTTIDSVISRLLLLEYVDSNAKMPTEVANVIPFAVWMVGQRDEDEEREFLNCRESIQWGNNKEVSTVVCHIGAGRLIIVVGMLHARATGDLGRFQIIENGRKDFQRELRFFCFPAELMVARLGALARTGSAQSCVTVVEPNAVLVE